MAKKSSEKDIAKLYEAKHRYNLKGYQKQIDNIYREAAKEAASLSMLIGDFDPDVPFSFGSYPITHQRIEKLLNGLGKGLEATIVNGVRSEWTLANNKNNELSRMVFGDNIGQLSEAQYSRYFSTNQKALEAYMGRKRDGLNLSERVWRYADQFKQEIEMGIDIGLRDGLPANEMATSLKQYLQHPDKLFRRVRDEHGELQLSKAAKAYHPGQGVYRSSYKNARRLAVTEGNIAFHTADYLRMQEMDFIVGQHVILSNNHTCLGVKGVFYDICDELSGQNEDDPKGRYPKDFKFTGWHPHCRCGVIAIMKTEEEIAEDTRKILAGEPLDGESVNKISDVPEEFKEWLEQNEDRIAHAKNLPYFMAENEKYCPEMEITLRARAAANKMQRNNEAIIEVLKPTKKTPLEIAEERHAARTPEQIEEIKKRWEEREVRIEAERIQEKIYQDELIKAQERLLLRFPGKDEAEILNFLRVDVITLSRNNGDIDPQFYNICGKMFAEGKSSVEIERYIQKEIENTRNRRILDYYRNTTKSTRERSDEEILRIIKGANDRIFSKEQMQSMDAFERKTGFIRGLRMSIEDADKQSANPKHVVEFYRDKRGRYISPVTGVHYRDNPKYDNSSHKQYKINCATCAPAYQLRLWGFDITAKGRVPGSGTLNDLAAYNKSFEMWKNQDGSDVKPMLTADWMTGKGYTEMNRKRYMQFIKESCTEDGTYIFTIGWEGGGGHATIIQKINGRIYNIEPQEFMGAVRKGIKRLGAKGALIPYYERGILRIDDKIFDSDWAGLFEKGV